MDRARLEAARDKIKQDLAFARKWSDTGTANAYSDAILAIEVEIKQAWISVEDRHPDEGENTVINDKEYGVLIGEHFVQKDWLGTEPDKHIWFIDNDCWIAENVTHWKPLPEPPEENNNG